MKVTQDHLSTLRAAISPLDTQQRRDIYRSGQFPRADAVKDLNKRYRWDLLWAAVRAGHSLPDSTDGYSTAHLDTALRHLVAPLGTDYQDACPNHLGCDAAHQPWQDCP